MKVSKSTACSYRYLVGIVLSITLVLSGCSTAGKERIDAFNQSAGPMIAVRLATVAAVQGDPVRAQRVVDETDKLLADIAAGNSIAIDVLVPLLNSRIAEASLKPAERAVLAELVSVAAQIVTTDSVLPEDSKERLRVVLTWVRSAALAQTLVK